MENFAVILVFTVILSVCKANVELLPPSGEVCLGIAATFTCTVNGSVLAWRYGGSDAVPELFGASSGTTNLDLLGSGPFSTRITGVTGGVMTSIATTSNLTRDANGMTLECANGSFTSGTTQIDSVTLPLQETSVPSSIDVSFTSVGASITWTRATCASFYRVYAEILLDETFLGETAGTFFFYTPQSPGAYSFRIHSINYFGEDVRFRRSKPFNWLIPTTSIQFNVTNGSLMVSFKDSNNGQPSVNYCVIILNDDSTPCQISGTYTFPIRDRIDYTYNVTVGNVVGSISEVGTLEDLIVPTTALVSVIETEPAETVTSGYPVTGDPVIFAVPFIVLGVLMILSICWILLRICWKKQWCCPRIWRSSFWLLFFCYDCCTYDAGEKEGNTIGLKNPNVGGEKGNNTPL